MGAQRFGIEGNAKTNEIARQQRQMNGYPLRSFLATGGPIILPPKHGEGLMGIPMNMGLTQYTDSNAVMSQSYVSQFTEPLNAPLENNTILLAKAGIQARSESASNPYKTLQFLHNMHASVEQIRENEKKHLELRGFNHQQNINETLQEKQDFANRVEKRQRESSSAATSSAATPPRTPAMKSTPFRSPKRITVDSSEIEEDESEETGEEQINKRHSAHQVKRQMSKEQTESELERIEQTFGSPAREEIENTMHENVTLEDAVDLYLKHNVAAMQIVEERRRQTESINKQFIRERRTLEDKRNRYVSFQQASSPGMGPQAKVEFGLLEGNDLESVSKNITMDASAVQTPTLRNGMQWNSGSFISNASSTYTDVERVQESPGFFSPIPKAQLSFQQGAIRATSPLRSKLPLRERQSFIPRLTQKKN